MLGLLTASAVAAAVVLAVMAGYVSRRGGSRAGVTLAVMLLSVAWWAAAYAMELSSTDGVQSHWGDAKYVGIELLAPAWLVFVALYTGREHLVTRTRILLLAVEPVLVWVLLAVPATHDLIRFYRASPGPNGLPVVGAGPLFWATLVYGNVILLMATVMFVRTMVRLSRTYRVAAVVLVTAALAPWAVNILYNFEVGPFARLDLTPFAFVLTGAVLVWGLYRERLIDLSSVAWGLVVHTMADGVILCDAFGRVNDANPAAVTALGLRRADLVGRQLTEVLPLPADPTAAPASETPDGPVRHDTEVTLGAGEDLRYLELRRQRLTGPVGARKLGELVLLRDVTERRQGEHRTAELLAERTRIAATLQSSLLPVGLPSIPGCELAAVYEPAGAAHEVGGDFYDVFPLDGSRWGVVLGDVSGKGAPAAAVTALVRYTLRTLALEHDRPSEVLRRLNDVLLRDGDGERYCTVAYAVARVTAAGVDLRLCLGGHHPPLLRSAAGRVRPVGEVGTAIGLIDEPELTDTAVRLGPGDLLCLFTDGLVEARRGGVFFGGDRVADLLGAAGGGAPEPVLEGLARAAREFHSGPLSDDLALLALSVPAGATASVAASAPWTGSLSAAREDARSVSSGE